MTTLRRRQVFSFGLSGLAHNVMATCLGVHLFVFYTDVVGLTPLWVSGGLVVATLFDAVSDVWMGRRSDGTRWRAGRRRPYLLLGALPLALGFFLLLSPPSGLSQTALGLYFTGAMLLLFLAKTVVHVPALSLLPEMATDYDQRTRLAAAREQLGNVGDLLGLLLPLLMLLAWGVREDGDPAAAREAFSAAGALIAGVSLLAVLGAWLGTHESGAPPTPARPAREVWAALRGNHAFRILLTSSGLAALGLAFAQSLILFVLEHVIGTSDPATHLAAFVINALAAIGSYPLWTWLADKHGKPAAFRLGLGLSALTFSTVFFAGPGDFALLFAVMVFGGAANVGFWMLMHALSADVVDLDELEHGVRREGMFAGFTALIRKCAFALAAGGVGVGLWSIGYVEGTPPSAATLGGLKLLFAIPPTVLVVSAWWLFRGYPLTRERQLVVQRRLGKSTAESAHARARSSMASSNT